jgi:glc operon protein GlcG
MSSLKQIGATVVLAIGIAGVGQAQVVEKRALTLEAAKRVVMAATAEARRDVGTGVIAVVDDGGNLMLLERLDNTFPAGAMVSIGKARTAATFRKPTAFFENVIKNGRTAMTALPDFTPLQGGIPLEIDGQIVGGIGVSGAASALRDEEVALAGAAALKGMASADQRPTTNDQRSVVSYFDREQVAEAFRKGAVLFDGSEYMVHTSRREKPGMAEVHTRDTDIIYVQSGTATLVTGGEVVDGRSTAPDEIRGASIRGGETHTIGRGDVIIVPAGTPHWFKEVNGPVTYYVVKAR